MGALLVLSLILAGIIVVARARGGRRDRNRRAIGVVSSRGAVRPDDMARYAFRPVEAKRRRR